VTPDEKEKLEKLSASQIKHKYLSGKKLKTFLLRPGKRCPDRWREGFDREQMMVCCTSFRNGRYL